MNVAHRTELEQLALVNIRAAAQAGSLLTAPFLPHTLRRWRDWGDEKEVTEWVNTVIREDEGLLTFLEAFLQKGLTHSMDDTVGTVTYHLDPQWLEPFLAPTEIVERVQNLRTHTDLTEN